ncbi:MAG: tetratricopeptide repeat protein [Kiritimatiellia bacterium]
MTKLRLRVLGISLLIGLTLALLLYVGCGRDRAAQHLENGMKKLGEGDYTAAAALLEMAAASGSLSNSASLHCNLGIALWKVGKTSQAIQHLNQAVALTQHDPRALEFLACVLNEIGDRERARVALDRARQRASSSPRVLTAMAALEWRTGRADLARPLLTRALEINPEYPPALYNLAVLHRDAYGDYAQAAEFFQRYLKSVDQLQVPDTTPLDKHAAIARQFLAHWGPSVQSAKPPSQPTLPESVASRTALSSTESTAEAAQRLLAEGMNAHKEGDLDRAILSYKRALAYNPRLGAAAYNLGLAYKAKGELDLAERSFLSAIQNAPNLTDARYMLGVVYWELKQNAKAVEQFQTVLRQKPDHARSHYLLGVVKREENRLAEARKHFEEFVRLEPTGPLAERVRAWLDRTKQRP